MCVLDFMPMICSFEHYATGLIDSNCYLEDDDNVEEKWVSMSQAEGGPFSDHTLDNSIGK